jgi:hypothetical protein
MLTGERHCGSLRLGRPETPGPFAVEVGVDTDINRHERPPERYKLRVPSPRYNLPLWRHQQRVFQWPESAVLRFPLCPT